MLAGCDCSFKVWVSQHTRVKGIKLLKAQVYIKYKPFNKHKIWTFY